MVFFSHPDHLGSANWITDAEARIVHEYHYAPYGELIVDNSWDSNYDERYKFTGKERDTETGYDYFGARFFWSALGIFISSDPLSYKHPELSSYAYCANNPIKYVDPDGRIYETPWDIFWVVCDGLSFTYNTIIGDAQEAALDAACFATDGAAVFIPGGPAVAGPAKTGAKLAPKVAEATPKVAKAAEKVVTATRNTYRKVLMKVTGKNGIGYEAHHTLPQAFREKFEKLGFNIDDPEYVVWRKTENHRAENTRITEEWREWFKNNKNPTREQVLQKRRDIETERFGNTTGDTPLN